MKDKVENPALKNNLSLDSISNFFANILSGNEIMSNLEVKKLTHLNKLEVGEKMRVEGDSEFSNVILKERFISKVFNITDDRITFNPEATIKMSNSKLVFRIKDIFEVITFMKYVVKICGSRLEKCDFGNLLSNSQQEQMKKVMKLLEERQSEIKKIEQEYAKTKPKEDSSLANKSNGKALEKNKTRGLGNRINSNLRGGNNSSKGGNESNSSEPEPLNSYMFKEKPNKKAELFDHQDEIEKELNLQLKLYKEKQKQELFENSYTSFLNNKSFINEDQMLNDYYYNLDMNFFV